ncbi:MAG TPA: hypothetical protein VFM28_03260 [Nitrososphaeraceae archaeon]|jgi:archaellum component FlaF (FlaF/FlaG flagellin family)|nr:hypothetical protein [Nitrososphaeraceae archaeon]
MKIVISIIFIVVIGILFGLVQQVYSQIGAAEQMMGHMRFTHSQLANNVDQVIQLVKSNNTAEAITLLEGMELKIDHMNTMFNDLVWELSNKGH